MGIRFRKSLSFGNGVRINLSKSGIGYSCGFRGVRFTKMSNGRNRSTFSIPSTGVSYVEESSSSKQISKEIKDTHSENDELAIRINNDLCGSTDEIKNGPLTEMQPIEYKSILRSVKWHIAINNLLWAFVPLLLLAFYYQNNYFFISACLSFLLKILIHIFFRIKLDYSIDDEILKSYDEFKLAWKTINKSKKHWQLVEQRSNRESKRLAGTGTNYKRVDFRISINRLPWYFKSNLKVPVLHLYSEKFYLLPDKLLICRRWSVGAVNHKDITYEGYKREFVENLSVPKDSKVVRYQWLYTNKDGTRDKRYKNNIQFPLCNYGEIDITSTSGLNTSLVISNPELAITLNEKILSYQKILQDNNVNE